MNVNQPQVDGKTALHWAVQLHELDLAQLLVDAGANPDVVNRTDAKPLQLAALNGSALMLPLLLEAGAEVNAPQTISADTALMIAARTGKADAVNVLLEYGANIDAQERWGGTTALMWAVNENQ